MPVRLKRVGPFKEGMAASVGAGAGTLISLWLTEMPSP